MIRYALKCDQGHSFESWFKSGEAFDTLHSSGLVACTHCGSSKVTKSLMAPSVRTDKERPLTTTASPEEEAIAKLRKEVEENSDYVGMSFASEARKMHEGDAPKRNIYGETKPEEAIKLLEEGIPVAPLPFTPRKQTN